MTKKYIVTRSAFRGIDRFLVQRYYGFGDEHKEFVKADGIAAAGASPAAPAGAGAHW